MRPLFGNCFHNLWGGQFSFRYLDPLTSWQKLLNSLYNAIIALHEMYKSMILMFHNKSFSIRQLIFRCIQFIIGQFDYVTQQKTRHSGTFRIKKALAHSWIIQSQADYPVPHWKWNFDVNPSWYNLYHSWLDLCIDHFQHSQTK